MNSKTFKTRNIWGWEGLVKRLLIISWTYWIEGQNTDSLQGSGNIAEKGVKRMYDSEKHLKWCLLDMPSLLYPWTHRSGGYCTSPISLPSWTGKEFVHPHPSLQICGQWMVTGRRGVMFLSGEASYKLFS